MNWYYALNGAQQGPVSEQELAQLAAGGTIMASTLVWKEGLPDWQPLSVALPAALTTSLADAPQIGGYAVPEAQKDLIVQQMREGVMPQMTGAIRYAGFWIRFVARFIDGIIMQVVGMIVMLPFGAAVQGLAPKPGHEPTPEEMIKFFTALLPMIAVGMAIGILYDVVMVVKYGGTLGKLAVGIKIVNDDGTKVGVGKAIGRFFAHMLSAMVCYIGYIIAAFDSEKRSLHDHVCSTRVTYTR